MFIILSSSRKSTQYGATDRENKSSSASSLASLKMDSLLASSSTFLLRSEKSSPNQPIPSSLSSFFISSPFFAEFIFILYLATAPLILYFFAYYYSTLLPPYISRLQESFAVLQLYAKENEKSIYPRCANGPPITPLLLTTELIIIGGCRPFLSLP